MTAHCRFCGSFVSYAGEFMNARHWKCNVCSHYLKRKDVVTRAN